MGRRRGTPERSKLVLADAPLAFSKRTRGRDDDPPDELSDEPEDQTAAPASATVTDGKPVEDASTLDTKPVSVIGGRPDPKDLPAIEPPARRDEPWPDATPAPMKPVAAPTRQHNETIGFPIMPAPDFGRPPAMPTSAAPPPLVLGDVENPAHMPGPMEVPSGNPDDPAPPPGNVPPGDSRSLRMENEFALIYRIGTCVITRTGRIGTRGQWRVVDYPTSAAASNAYAKECSRFVSEGFSDYRE
jgi:predicted DNA-binding WGR domain protein